MGSDTLVVLLPVATLLAAWYALRPTRPVVAPNRLTLVRAAVLVGCYAVACVEVLSALRLLDRGAFLTAWVLALVIAVGAAVVRSRREWRPQGSPERLPEPAPGRPAPGPGRPGLLDGTLFALLALLAAVTLTVALAAEPNNWDSQAYHLPKVEHWIFNGSVGPFAAFYPPQVAFAPGAEYLLLHLRLLTGGDALYNLLQWGSVVLATATAARIAAQLGAGRTGQLITAFAVAATPMVLLQATSTQTDMVTAAWCAAVVTLVLDAVRDRDRSWRVLLIGVALGLAWLTKTTGAAIAGPFVAYWFIAAAIRVRSVRAGGALVVAATAVAAVALAVTGPFLLRTMDTYGSPLGPVEAIEHSMRRHDPAALVVNAAKFVHSASMTPSDEVNELSGRAVGKLAKVLDVNINDPRIAMVGVFPRPIPYLPDEDSATLPLQVAAIAAGLGYALVRWRRNPRVAAYAVTVVMVGLVIITTVKWQFWLTRLLMPAVTLSLPLVGLALGNLLSDARAAYRRVAAVAVGLLLVLSTVEAANTVLHGAPRPLIGPASVLEAGPWETRFARLPQYRADYQEAAARIRATGARRVGLVVGGGIGFEYPMYVLLPGLIIVPLESSVPGRPPADPTDVDAIVCVSKTPRCADFIPAGWTLEGWTYAQVVLPPRVAGAVPSS
jgi:hypothetical protein